MHCSELQEPPKKQTEKLVITEDGKIRYMGNRNHYRKRDKILQAAWCPIPNHECKFLWRLVKEFWHGKG